MKAELYAAVGFNPYHSFS